MIERRQGYRELFGFVLTLISLLVSGLCDVGQFVLVDYGESLCS